MGSVKKQDKIKKTIGSVRASGKKVFEGNDTELSKCVTQLNKIYEVIDRIREQEKVENRTLTPDEREKQEHTISMLDGICDALDTVIEDTDRLSVHDDDGTIFN